MSENMAQEYAESVGKGFWAASEAGAPFGLVEEAQCRECGSTYDPSDNEPCPSGNDDEDQHLPEDDEAMSAYDYLEGVLDIDYIANAQHEYKGAEVMIAWGGPAAWIDTRERRLVVAWGGDRGSWSLPSDLIDQLDDALEELWGMR